MVLAILEQDPTSLAIWMWVFSYIIALLALNLFELVVAIYRGVKELIQLLKEE